MTIFDLSEIHLYIQIEIVLGKRFQNPKFKPFFIQTKGGR